METAADTPHHRFYAYVVLTNDKGDSTRRQQKETETETDAAKGDTLNTVRKQNNASPYCLERQPLLIVYSRDT